MGTVCSTEVPVVHFVPPERRVRNARAAPAEATVTSNTQATASPSSDPSAFAPPRTTAARTGAPTNPSPPLRKQTRQPAIAAARSSTSTQRTDPSVSTNPLAAPSTTAAEFVAASPDPNRPPQARLLSTRLSSPQGNTSIGSEQRRAYSCPPISVPRSTNVSLLPSAVHGQRSFDTAAPSGGSFPFSEPLEWSFAVDSRRGSGAPQGAGRTPAAGGRGTSGAFSAPEDAFGSTSQRTSSSAGLWGSSFVSAEASAPLDVPSPVGDVAAVESAVSSNAEDASAASTTVPTPQRDDAVAAVSTSEYEGAQSIARRVAGAKRVVPQHVTGARSDSPSEFCVRPASPITFQALARMPTQVGVSR